MAGRNGRTVRDLRRGNRTAVLQRLYFDGPLSRFELGPATGLSSGSVSNVVAELIADGLRSIDFQGVVRGQLAKMDATALERLLTANICEELIFIQTSGGIFGFLVGLAILYPFLRPLFILGGFTLWGIYRWTVEKK